MEKLRNIDSVANFQTFLLLKREAGIQQNVLGGPASSAASDSASGHKVAVPPRDVAPPSSSALSAKALAGAASPAGARPLAGRTAQASGAVLPGGLSPSDHFRPAVMRCFPEKFEESYELVPALEDVAKKVADIPMTGMTPATARDVKRQLFVELALARAAEHPDAVVATYELGRLERKYQELAKETLAGRAKYDEKSVLDSRKPYGTSSNPQPIRPKGLAEGSSRTTKETLEYDRNEAELAALRMSIQSARAVTLEPMATTVIDHVLRARRD